MTSLGKRLNARAERAKRALTPFGAPRPTGEFKRTLKQLSRELDPLAYAKARAMDRFQQRHQPKFNKPSFSPRVADFIQTIRGKTRTSAVPFLYRAFYHDPDRYGHLAVEALLSIQDKRAYAALTRIINENPWVYDRNHENPDRALSALNHALDQDSPFTRAVEANLHAQLNAGPMYRSEGHPITPDKLREVFERASLVGRAGRSVILRGIQNIHASAFHAAQRMNPVHQAHVLADAIATMPLSLQPNNSRSEYQQFPSTLARLLDEVTPEPGSNLERFAQYRRLVDAHEQNMLRRLDNWGVHVARAWMLSKPGGLRDHPEVVRSLRGVQDTLEKHHVPAQTIRTIIDYHAKPENLQHVDSLQERIWQNKLVPPFFELVPPLTLIAWTKASSGGLRDKPYLLSDFTRLETRILPLVNDGILPFSAAQSLFTTLATGKGLRIVRDPATLDAFVESHIQQVKALKSNVKNAA